jgi:hypothetical protein
MKNNFYINYIITLKNGTKKEYNIFACNLIYNDNELSFNDIRTGQRIKYNFNDLLFEVEKVEVKKIIVKE